MICRNPCANIHLGIFLDSPYDARFTNAGDTVVSLSAERHNVVEGALARSRRVELFVSNAQSKDAVLDSMKTSFTRAYKDGKWKVKLVCPLSWERCRLCHGNNGD